MSAALMIAEWENLVGKRYNWDSFWQDTKDVVWPHDQDFLIDRTPGERKAQRQFDMTGALAVEKFGAVFESLLTPRQQRFHILKASDPNLMKDRAVATFFEEKTNLLFQMRNNAASAFYDQAHEGWKSLAAYGNQCLNVEKLAPRYGVGLSYRQVHISAVWVETNPRGLIETIFFKFKISAHAAIEKWGLKRAPKAAHDLISRHKPWDELEFLHVVKPNMKQKPDAIGPERHRFLSWEISLKDKEYIPWEPFPGGPLLDGGGYHTLPYIYSRFSTNAMEKHGRGPAMIVLADNSQLQDMERSSTLATQVAAEPPSLTMDDDLLGDATGELDLRPSGMNPGWLDEQGNPKVKPYVSGMNYQMTEDAKEKKREIIRDAHFLTLFQILVDTPEMTATEALLRAQEKGMLIAPTVGRQQGESLGRVIDRELDLIDELGTGPEMPPLLIEAEGDYEVEYSSQATRLQREEEVQGINATIVDMAPMAQIDPNVTRVMRIPEAARFIAKARGVPAHLILSAEEFDEEIAIAAEQAAQAELIEAAPGLASAAKDLDAAGIQLDETGGGGLAA